MVFKNSLYLESPRQPPRLGRAPAAGGAQVLGEGQYFEFRMTHFLEFVNPLSEY